MGLMLFFKSIEQIEVKKTKWYFSFYNKNFQLVWTKGLPLGENMEFKFSEYHRDTLFLLFSYTGKKKGSDPAFQILSVILSKASFVLNQGNLPEDAEISFFSVAHNQVWMGIQLKNSSDQMLSLNLLSGNRRQFPLGEGNQISMRWLSADTSGQFATAVVTRRVSKKSWEHYLLNYDSAGKMSHEYLIGNLTSDRNYSGFQVYKLSNEKTLVTGAYSLNGEKESSGLFSLILFPGGKSNPNFYNFLDFKNALSFLSEKDLISLKKKTLKKSKNGGEYPLGFNILLHPVMHFNNDFILCVELYNPQYRTENFTDFDFYGRPYSNSYTVFDGNRYEHALIAGFSEEGILKWDNAIAFRNLLSFEFNTKLNIFPSGDNLVLCYLSDGRIGYKIIQAHEVIEKPDFIPVELLFPGDKLIDESRSSMFPWYGRYFLCSGYQEIKNVSLESNNRRLVFFFSKICFEE